MANNANIVVTGYCVKCKAKDKKMNGATEVEMPGKGGNVRKAVTGTCETCGTKMFRILGADGLAGLGMKKAA